jgi:hypothetical protein
MGGNPIIKVELKTWLRNRQEGEMILEKRSVRLCERISTMDD